jgi:hypothetical protein
LSNNSYKALQQSGIGRRLRLTLLCLQIYVILGGLLSLIGWVVDIPRLTDWIHYGISIQPNSALAAVCAGAAIICASVGFRKVAAGLGILVASIGLTVLFQYLFGINLGIDTLLMFHRAWGNSGVLSPGRMGPNGAVSWTLIGIAIVFAAKPEGTRSRILIPLLSFVTVGFSGLSLIGYLYGASSLFTVPTATIIAVQTATFVMCSSIGLILTVPDRGPLRIFVDRGPAGTMARRILPTLLLIPVFLGYFRVLGERHHFYDSPFGSALRTILEIGLFLLLLWRAGVAVHRQVQRRSESDAALRLGERRVSENI